MAFLENLNVDEIFKLGVQTYLKQVLFNTKRVNNRYNEAIKQVLNTFIGFNKIISIVASVDPTFSNKNQLYWYAVQDDRYGQSIQELLINIEKYHKRIVVYSDNLSKTVDINETKELRQMFVDQIFAVLQKLYLKEDVSEDNNLFNWIKDLYSMNTSSKTKNKPVGDQLVLLNLAYLQKAVIDIKSFMQRAKCNRFVLFFNYLVKITNSDVKNVKRKECYHEVWTKLVEDKSFIVNFFDKVQLNLENKCEEQCPAIEHLINIMKSLHDGADVTSFDHVFFGVTLDDIVKLNAKCDDFIAKSSILLQNIGFNIGLTNDLTEETNTLKRKLKIVQEQPMNKKQKSEYDSLKNVDNLDSVSKKRHRSMPNKNSKRSRKNKDTPTLTTARSLEFPKDEVTEDSDLNECSE